MKIFCIVVMDRIERRRILTFLLLLAGIGQILNVIINTYAGDNFYYFLLDGVFEIASKIFCILVMDRIGRRILLTFLLLLAGIGLILSVIVNTYAGDNQCKNKYFLNVICDNFNNLLDQGCIYFFYIVCF